MRRNLGPALALTAALVAGGCTSAEREPAAANDNEAAVADVDALNFDPNDPNRKAFSAGVPYRNPHTWAAMRDSNIDDVELGDRIMGMYSENGEIEHGAAIRALGGGAYQIATSDGQHHIIEDIQNENFSTFIPTGNGDFDMVLTARYEKAPADAIHDDAAHFLLTVIPDFDFHGNLEVTPLPIPDVDQWDTTTTTVPITSL